MSSFSVSSNQTIFQVMKCYQIVYENFSAGAIIKFCKKQILNKYGAGVSVLKEGDLLLDIVLQCLPTE